MENNNKSPTLKSKKSSKIIIAAVCIAVVLVAAFVGVYYCVLPNQPANVPEPVTNFSDGSWANYTLTVYNENGTIASDGNMMAVSVAGTYNGTNCWVYVENVTYTSKTDGTNTNDLITYYLDKTTYATLHQTEQVTSEGEVIYDGKFDSGEAGFMDTIAIVRNMTVVATGQSVTVPAGTFSTTQREGTLTYASESAVYDLTSWASTEVPTWGIVKYQFHLGNALFSEYLLESYGT